ncbi:NFX1-type zinc finger-containing protein 1 [Fusarium oxysporum f. sp. cubense]|uniref:NFX1-type zinc finger-containing protein 1 n=1 Tax=Fusarium oxysporum f. sp. cubense TaxID=61366 RepID=A0A559LA65_FUSOC|nr:NFX1-type zinc finger-containing protein 1 [Fusarium oxysporum f. sp. cubense]
MASHGDPPREPADQEPNIGEMIPQLCSDFQKSRCKDGKDCKLTHDPDTVYLPKPTMEASKLLAQPRTSLIMCQLDTLSLPQRSIAALSTWENVLKILDSPYRSLHQEVARNLAIERPGLQNMTTTVKDLLKTEGIRSPCVTAFIKVIAHSSFLNCSAIESDVNTIYSIFGGKDGHDGMGFMLFLHRIRLASLEPFTGSLSSEAYEKVLREAKVCHELARRASRSHFRTTKPGFLDTLDSLVAMMRDKFPKDNIDALVRRLDIIKRLAASPRTHLARADIPSAHEQDPQHHPASIPTTIDRPGGRHDNDFADIADVVIFPTTEEVIRVYEDYLPSTNFSNHHVLGDPFQRYIDSLFRLIRYDTMGPIVKALRDLCRSDNPAAGRLYQQDIRADTYLGCRVHNIFQSRKQELQVSFTFLLPQKISNQSIQRQKEWWKYSAPLEEGRLLCFVSQEADHQHILFFQVASKNHEHLETSNLKPRVTAKLLSHERSTIKQLARLVENKTLGVLVDFHGVLPDTFMPMFDNLQRIRLENHLPFYKWLTPSEPAIGEVPPPLYARREGFAFPLSCIAKDKNTTLKICPAQGLHGINLFDLKIQTGLDSGQCQGLIAALTREYALIQGPPGTGKSYLGVQLVQVLLAVRKQADVGPIVVSCYTNHALDQFLKHLDDVGINNIVRVGNRSTTPELESKNLRAIKVECLRTPVESKTLEKLNVGECKLLRDGKKAIDELVEPRAALTDPGLMKFISKTYPKIHRKFLSKRMVTIASMESLRTWLGKRPSAVEYDIQQLLKRASHDIHTLSASEKWALADHWTEEFSESKVDAVLEALAKSESHRKDVNNILDALDQRILSQAHVIGITISNAARKIDLLKSLSPKVMICEEAAEVTEPHLISTLIPGIEHLIQIGDHKQLRPKINEHNLGREISGKKWQLDRSQFERRAEGEDGLSPVPLAQLNVQRRMRPEISQLISTVYPELQDHPSVLSYPDVVGMRHNVFWLDHNQPEAQPAEGPHASSYCNRWEIEMATALVRHLVRQGEYKPEDIALLTPYTSQLCALTHALSEEIEISMESEDSQDSDQESEYEEDTPDQKLMRKRPLSSAVRLATVDNFQGEEAKVVIISLVRSNPRHKMGFLRTSNRINVLLSRARHGMYLIGDVNTYRQVPMWNDVYHKLSNAATVGTKLELCCPRHPDAIILWNLAAMSAKRRAIRRQCIKLSHVSNPVLAFEQHAIMGVQSAVDSRVVHAWFRFEMSNFPVAILQNCSTATRHWICIRLTVKSKLRRLFLNVATVSLSLVPNQSLRKTFIVPILAPKSFLAGTPVLEYAETVFVVPELPVTHGARPLAIVRVTLAIIDVQSFAMVRVHVMTANKLARFDARTPVAPPLVPKPAMNATSNVLGLVLTKAHAQCLVQHHATAFLAIEDAKESWTAVIDVQASAERNALLNIVRNAATRKWSRSTYWRISPIEKLILTRNRSFFLDVDTSSLEDLSIPFLEWARLVNRAIMNETAKQFLVKESNELYEIETNLKEHEQKLSTVWTSRNILLRGLKRSAKRVEERAEKHIQQTKPLIDAISMTQTQTIDDQSHVEALTSYQLTPGQQISLKAQLLVIRVAEVHVYSHFSESCLMPWTSTEVNAFQRWLKVQALPTLPELLCDCTSLIERAKHANMPRLVIIGTLSFARILRLWRLCNDVESKPDSGEDLSHAAIADELLKFARKLLDVALSLCSKLSKSEEWKEGVQETMRALKSQRKVIADKELVYNKNARIGGHAGMVTTSALWYNCVNGHPFAVGDCDMSTEVARCSECGAPVGGTNPRPLDGVTRAEEMETEDIVTEEPNEQLEVAVPEDEVEHQLSSIGGPPETEMWMYILVCMILVCFRIGLSTS